MDQTNYVLPLSSPLLTLDMAGGKGANLARLMRAGFPVPGGFVVATPAYQAFVEQARLSEAIARETAALDANKPEQLEASSARIRGWFEQQPVPEEIARVILASYCEIGQPPVAVRSSATAEDLPEFSFAGQQDTYLNVRGEAALLDAVRNCWGSLWTARAIGYRARNAVPQEGIALAVVVQAMVESESSGVMFTANPLTGQRGEVMIDAIFGLGEALVSGRSEPDQIIVRKSQNNRSAAVTGRRLGSKGVILRGAAAGGLAQETGTAGLPALTEDQTLALAELGERVEAEYGAPQDIEWALSDGRLYLLQSRAITSLYPLPEGVSAEPLQVFGPFGAVQGMLDPITPLGQDMIKLIGVGVGRYLGMNVTIESQSGFQSAGERLFLNLTPLVRNRIGRKVLPQILKAVEPGTRPALLKLLDEPALQPGKRTLSLTAALQLARIAVPTPFRMIYTLLRPDFRRQQAQQKAEDLYRRIAERAARADNLADQVRVIENLFEELPSFMLRVMIPAFAPGVAMINMLYRLADGVPEGQQLALGITRGLPHNVTTEMDLALWGTASQIRADAASAEYFSHHPAEKLAADYLNEQLPPAAQQAVERFLERYGMRGVGEIDMGRPRWREDPTPVMQALLSYLQITDAAAAPDATFARGAAEAGADIEKLAALVRQRPGGRRKAHQVRLAAQRMRALSGLRELPKFLMIRVMGLIRTRLLATGQAMTAAGVLNQPDDIFFLHFTELRDIAALQDPDGGWTVEAGSPLAALAGLTAGRRARWQREKLRRQIPRLLLSDGRAFFGESVGTDSIRADGTTGESVITGSPVSPGIVEGRVRVVFDPHGAQLQPGEILVCPGTDPAWTPLFLAAGGLVMEVGGLMTHGSVVAREYGIPAVVGVHEATQRLKTGQKVRVDGSKGEVTLLED